MLTIRDTWTQSYPGARFGVLVMKGVGNPPHHPGLDKIKAELESDLRTLFKDRGELKTLEPIKAYQQYYKRFDKTYHVLQQLESVIFKKKPIASVSALVDCMFIEEIRNSLLTAGHDLDFVEKPMTLDTAKGDESFTRINGKDQTLKSGDMILRDSKGIISSVLYGPDHRTRIRPATTNVLFTVYAVPGIGDQAVTQHLQGIETNVKVVAPGSTTDLLKIF